MTIHLMPDWTVAVQLAIFLSALSIIYFLVLKPILKIIDRRNIFTINARSEAGELGSKADGLDSERKISIFAALKETEARLAGDIASAKLKADEIIAGARRQAKEILDSSEESIEASERSFEKEIQNQADAVANEIVARTLGK